MFLAGIGFVFSGIFQKDSVAGEKNPRIDSYLQSKIVSSKENEFLDIYLAMKDRTSLAEMQRLTSGLKRKERRKEVVRILKEYASRTQNLVLSGLRDAEGQGKVKHINILWINNVIAFQAMPSVVLSIASAYKEIDKIYYDPTYSNSELQDDLGITEYNKENDLYFYGGSRAPQPGLTLINAPLVWAEGDSGQGVVVSNIDSGTDWDHPDLINNIWQNLGEDADGDGKTLEWNGLYWVFDSGDINNFDDDANGRIDDFIGWDFAGNDNNPDEGSGSHGTATAGVLAGDGTNGTQTGVAPRAKLMNLRYDGAGESAFWAAEQYAVENGADIITSSYSFKWYFNPQPNYPMFRQVNDMELAAGVFRTNSTSNDGNSVGIPLNIAAPGNSPSPWIHPDQSLVGDISGVIGCGNVSALTDIIASSSPWGPATWEDFQINHPSFPYPMPLQYQDYPYETQPGSIGLIKPDISAPGNGTTSTAPGGGYQSFSGTSSATPHTAGTAALLWSANPDLEPADLARILQVTAIEKGDPGKDNLYGAGRIDAYAAYEQAIAEAGLPLAPLGPSAYSDYSTPTSMELNWHDPQNLFNGDTLYSIDFSIHIMRDSVWIDSVVGGSQAYIDNGLIDGQEYSYQIYAKMDSSKRESEIVETTWTAGGSPFPSAPVSLGISVDGDDVIISWRNASLNIDGTPMDDFAGIKLYQDDILLSSFSRSPSDTGIQDSQVITPSVSHAPLFYISAFDNETPVNESEKTDTVITPNNAPVVESFALMGDLNPLYWNNRDADINDRSVDPPSAPYALNLNGKPGGGDMVELFQTDLSGYGGSGIVFSYYYQAEGNGNAPEVGDSLLVHLRNDAGEWVGVRGYAGTSGHSFKHEVIELESEPAGGGTFIHSQFQLRIRSIGSPSQVTPNDDWFIDNIYLGVPAAVIAVSKDTLEFDSTLVGGSDSLELVIQNIGLDTLEVLEVLGGGGVFGVDSSGFRIAPTGAKEMWVRFSPQTSGNYSGWLGFVSNDPVKDTLRVYVEGSGYLVTAIVEGGEKPLRYGIGPNYPNPFNPATAIGYQLPEMSEVRLVVYNILGQVVRVLLDERVEPGYHRVEWDGRDAEGSQVSSGLYIYRFEAGPYRKAQKMMLLK